MCHLQSQKTGREFLPHHLHRVVAISVVLAEPDKVKVWSLGDTGSSERDLIKHFFGGIEKFVPDLVSWNGSGFDLPVLYYRALSYGIAAPTYWEIGERNRAFRYNSYLGRFHWRHLDLMDVLSGYQLRAAAPLDDVAKMLGFPGKNDMRGGDVWEAYQQGDIAGIRNYCETDVLNTYLIYLRFQLMRGEFTDEEYKEECRRVADSLTLSNFDHLRRFLEQWKFDRA